MYLNCPGQSPCVCRWFGTADDAVKLVEKLIVQADWPQVRARDRARTRVRARTMVRDRTRDRDGVRVGIGIG